MKHGKNENFIFGLIVIANAAFSQQYQDKKLIILGADPDPLIYIGAERIKEKAKTTVDLFHSSSYETPATPQDKVTIILGAYKDLPENLQMKIKDQPSKEDAFVITTAKNDPVTIVGSGFSARGTMYAAYKIAEMIEMNLQWITLIIFMNRRSATGLFI